MMKSNNDLPKINKEEMQSKLDLIQRANTCSVLMAQLCKELNLDPSTTSHQMFVSTFSELQKQSLEYQKEMQELYISATKVKVRKKRENKKEDSDLPMYQQVENQIEEDNMNY